MLRRNLFKIFLIALVSNQFTPVALAQTQRSNTWRTRLDLEQPDQRNSHSDRSFSTRKSSTITIPEFSAVTTTFCTNVLFNQEQVSVFPVTLSLARPIMDSNGEVIAPVNSLVSANINATDEDNITIQPKALIIGGRYIPIETSSVSVPALTDNRRSSNFFSTGFSQGQRGVAFRVADNLSDWLISRPTALSDDSSNLLSFGLSLAMGVAQGLNEPSPPDPEEREVLEIRQGIQLIFPLTSSVELPAVANHQSPYFSNRQPAPVCQDGEVRQSQNPTQYDDSNEID